METRLLLLLITPVLVAACTSGPSPVTAGQAPAATTPVTSAATPAPGVDLALQSFDGKTVHLSDFKGKAVLVNSWAGWCPFCVAEMPDLRKAEQALGDRAVVLFVHRTATEAQATGENFMKRLESQGSPAFDRGRVLIDPPDSFYKTYFGFGMPVSLFIKPDGSVAEKKVGSMDLNEAKERLARAFG